MVLTRRYFRGLLADRPASRPAEPNFLSARGRRHQNVRVGITATANFAFTVGRSPRCAKYKTLTGEMVPRNRHRSNLRFPASSLEPEKLNL